ncbi:large-conductance mechanosensitive channel protein MscL [Marinoscillum sp. MHG1-6]|uniref:large-conductance mechanosensitive channel protein MscL n=1 Tax=Marinoscillum sp. MHG1-6 TaxID=2959627 RepID=UPI0021585F40|nr:large-conductance mechanosensitive channel protein MscL [Marinoscillum sp. MHG1-6]
MWKEFKTFIMKGNILDLAVAVIIGSAFKSIVTSFVKDIIMPPIGVALGGVDFRDLTIELVTTTDEVAAVTINYGIFLQTIIDFLIISFVIFMVIKGYNKMQRKKEEAPAPPPEPSKEELLLTEIRDILKQAK